jgi:hypothetical protein
MAVVSKLSSLISDRSTGNRNPDPEFARGRPIVATGTVANAATDSSGSKYLLARIPSHALLCELTAFGVTNWGFAQIVIGSETATTALVNQTKATGNTVKPVVFGDAKHGLHLWQVLGLAADPKGDLEIYAHAAAAATGAGSMVFQIAYYAR